MACRSQASIIDSQTAGCCITQRNDSSTEVIKLDSFIFESKHSANETMTERSKTDCTWAHGL